MDLFLAGRVHFIGIGGAGMSAIAKVLLERGVRVSGSDLKRSRATAVLSAMGADVHVGHDASLVEGASVVVVSSAIPDRNPELARARADALNVITRGEALAALLDDYRSVVVAGTHGKTTTTSMIVSILTAAGLDPTYLVGGGLNDAGTNARSGSSDLAVAESDESDGSFLLLSPAIAVVTNVEMDHVDRWSSFDELIQAFEAFIRSAAADGAVVVAAGGSLEEAARVAGRRVVTFGDGGDAAAAEVVASEVGMRFELVSGARAASVDLAARGHHNVSNALAAAAACIAAGLELGTIAAGLGTFRGVERRFDVQGEASGVTVIDDYAHHPTEVKATLSAARTGPWERVVAVFQPHRYSRTAALATAFGQAFGDADRVVITDVYGAGEEPVPGVSGKSISDALAVALPGRPVAYLPHRGDLLAYLTGVARPGDVVLTMGAGDITSLGAELLGRLEPGP
ncbi:MAG TPA: UDP-N-acetylmuramate--L-alanine ligase [Actinomycetota bacterium]|nr:UDP-N-acetylmuramate--L-alanine ligase [Actinomycetota bacterium]